MSDIRAAFRRDYALKAARRDAESSLNVTIWARENGEHPTIGFTASLQGGESILGIVTAIDGDLVTVVQDSDRGTTKFDINEIVSTNTYNR
ncbi:hypothetical protein [Catenuloplanes japonicus]|uniref:hypothetical protein n=1 Tax=Catenuloplanes japonicus TaxID=33876 RepID=UPI000525E083|nr:hypothetical protein [Catenuloplanes japonicus]